MGDNQQRTATTVSHRAMLVPPDHTIRSNLLEDVITVELSKPEAKAIVFTQTKRDADELATGSAFRVLSTGVLHGDLTQKQRDVTLENFKRGKFRVLVATDVAARGIDISGIDLVLQYQMPQNSDLCTARGARGARASWARPSSAHAARGAEPAQPRAPDRPRLPRRAPRGAHPPERAQGRGRQRHVLELDETVVEFFCESAQASSRPSRPRTPHPPHLPHLPHPPHPPHPQTTGGLGGGGGRPAVADEDNDEAAGAGVGRDGGGGGHRGAQPGAGSGKTTLRSWSSRPARLA